MNPLAPHYSRFRVSERLLLTGHSHQAWPDVAFEAQQRAWLDAAALVDDKWSLASDVADEVRAGFRRLLNDEDGDIALGQNTHELVVRLLSAVLVPQRANHARLITTDGEFHTIRRQLDRLAEEGVEVVKVAAHPAATLAERMASVVDDRAACVLVSSVLFETAEIVPNLASVAAACEKHGVALLVDAYHHLNVVPFELQAMGLANAYVVGGGYKYCQLGEGNCFLRIPPHCELRPMITGWFSEFFGLGGGGAREVTYPEGDARFAGATYDPTSHYRAAAVFEFHRTMNLTPGHLRSVSEHQVRLLHDGFTALETHPDVAAIVEMPHDRRAGFLAIRAPAALALVSRLRRRQLFCDCRRDILRLGPAPYLSDAQLTQAIQVLASEL